MGQHNAVIRDSFLGRLEDIWSSGRYSAGYYSLFGDRGTDCNYLIVNLSLDSDDLDDAEDALNALEEEADMGDDYLGDAEEYLNELI
jgi:hypothetical protein